MSLKKLYASCAALIVLSIFLALGWYGEAVSSPTYFCLKNTQFLVSEGTVYGLIDVAQELRTCKNNTPPEEVQEIRDKMRAGKI